MFFSFIQRAKAFARIALRACGFELVRYNYLRSAELRRIKILRDEGTSMVIDVGANAGQYAFGLRQGGFRGKILSFEPLPGLHECLKRLTKRDPLWEYEPFAIGEYDGEVQINSCCETQVSSVLCATGDFGTGTWKNTATQTVDIRRLDSVLGLSSLSGHIVHLKIDVQGYERQVLLGAERILDNVNSIELEMSTVQLYNRETLLPDLVCTLDHLGFRLASIDLVHVDVQTGHVLQVDGLFVRKVHRTKVESEQACV